MKTQTVCTNEMILPPCFGGPDNQEVPLSGARVGVTAATSHEHKEVVLKPRRNGAGGPGLAVFETWGVMTLHKGKVVTSTDFSLCALHSFRRTGPAS